MKTNFFIFGIISLMLVSCYQEYPAHFRQYIDVNASIDGLKTRATNASWEANDAIGIYMKISGEGLSVPALAENSKYITDGTSAFQSATADGAISFPLDGTDVDFIAYYPHQTTITDLTYPVNVSDQSSLPAIDLLYSNNAAGLNSQNPDVGLTFVHQLSKINVLIMPEDATSDLSGLTVTMTGVGTSATFSLADGTLSAPAITGNVAFNMSSDGRTAQAILLPMADFTGKSLIIAFGSNSYEFPLTQGVNITSFEKATQYTYNVTLSSQALSVSNATITDWVTGPSENVIIGSVGTAPVTGGTLDDPFTIEEAIANQGLMDRWVRGFIVGYYKTTSYKSFTTSVDDVTSTTNIALATVSTETDSTKTFPVQLSATQIRDTLNLLDHPENLGREVLVRGDLATYQYIAGMKAADGAVINGDTIP